MLTIKEAIAVKEEEEAELEAERSMKIVHRIANAKPKPERAPTRNPSFFQRMLSSRKMSQILSEINSDAGSEDERSNDEHDAAEGELADYFDPPLPFMGNPVNIDLLISRNEKAEYGLQKLMEMVIRDADEAVTEAKHLPVDKTGEMVTVTQEQSDRMMKIRSAKDIDKSNKRNMHHIQKALNIRKSALVIMNSNYSKQLVRKIEPIYVNEARSIVHQTGNEAITKIKPLAKQKKAPVNKK